MPFQLITTLLFVIVLFGCGRPESIESSSLAPDRPAPLLPSAPPPNSATPGGTSIGTSGGDINMERWMPLIRQLAEPQESFNEDKPRIDDLS